MAALRLFRAIALAVSATALAGVLCSSPTFAQCMSPPSFTSGVFPQGTVGQLYSFTVTASGLPPPTFSAVGLPAGLSISPSGVISGTPTSAGTSTVMVTASNGCIATQTQPLTVVSGSGLSPPSIVKSFGAATIAVNGSTSLSFAISNPNDGFLNGINFTDSLPQGLVVSTPNGLNGSCGGGQIVADAGSGGISLTGADLSGGAMCTFSVNVTGTTPGVQNNTTSNVVSSNGGAGNQATATVTVAAVIAPPTISKSFGAATMMVGESTSLSLSISNPNKSNTLTGVGFNDPLPQGLVISTPNGANGSCGGGTIVASAGAGAISLTGATLPAVSSCTFRVNVTATSSGTQVNTTDAVTSVEGGTGGTASASIRVSAPPPPPPPRCVPPTITSGPLPSGVVGAPYTASVTATGDSPIVLSVGGLPAGLTFNPATGSISGVPTASGTSTLIITANNGCQPGALQTQTLTVGQSTSSLTISATPNPAVFGQVITVVVRASGAPSTPLGVISLCAREVSSFCPPPFDVVPPGTPASKIRTPLSAPLDASGQATFTLTGLLIENYVFKAAYSGDAAHNGASAGPIDEFVIKGVLLAPPKVQLTAPLRATSGAPLSIGIRVTPGGPGPTPTGTVQLVVGANPVGAALLDAQGATQLTIAAAASGAFPLRAEYSGDAMFPPAESPESMVTIAAFATADIPAVGPVGLALLALALAALAMRPLYRRSRRS